MAKRSNEIVEIALFIVIALIVVYFALWGFYGMLLGVKSLATQLIEITRWAIEIGYGAIPR